MIQRCTAGYRSALRRMTEMKLAVVVVFFVGLALTWWIYRRVPTSFIPDEDQGYFMAVVQAPP